MSNAGSNFLPLFNNNKSLYGSRAQSNQSSKKISIIEDKLTLEPARAHSSSPVTSFTSHRSASDTNRLSSEPSSTHIQKQIQIQKHALHSFELEHMHEHVHEQLDQWKTSIATRVLSMKTRTLEENGQSYDQLVKFQHLMKKLLEETLIKQLLLMRDNPHSINTDELDRVEEQLDYIKKEIESMKLIDLQFNASDVEITGELQLNKMTDFSKHQPLPRPSPSPPPQPTPLLPIADEEPIPLSSSPDSIPYKPTAPVWTEATRQGLNSLSHCLPFRLLIPNYVREELINFDIEQFHAMLELSCQSPVESILTIINQNDLDESIDILTDLIGAFKCSSTHYELRLLFQSRFISIITGKRNERLERLRAKYQLDSVKIFTQVCPQSDERVLLIRSGQCEHIIYCLQEIIQNILEQAHFTDDDLSESYAMYDPSANYDETLTQDYGGYKSSDTCELIDVQGMVASSEELTEIQQRPTGFTHPSSSTSSLTRTRFNSEDAPLNYDDTDPESDENDDGLKRSKSSDDKRMFVKQLNYVKGRQVGLLIGPFGQHITQIREQTGAKIHLTNDDNEPSVIKGTKSQINQALRLIKECLQKQKPIPRTAYKGGRRR